jgi:pyruvate formate lyase activating enzyme
MIIAGLQKTTLIDFPDKIACIVFLAACNFRCPWCYSSELVLPLKIAKQPRLQEQEFFNFLNQRKGQLDGVVICVGEPTVNKELPKFIEKIKSLGFFVKLDTNGTNPKMLKDLVNAKLIDYVAMDIKATKEKYSVVFGEAKDIKDIEESVDFLKRGLVDFEFRTTVVPGIHEKTDFAKMADWIGGENIKYYLQSFVGQKTIDPEFEKIKPFAKTWLEDVVKEISPSFKICQLR